LLRDEKGKDMTEKETGNYRRGPQMTTATRSLPATFSAIFPWRSLKTRVTVSTLTFFLVGIWSLAFYASYTLHNDMEQALGEQQHSAVSIIASAINNAMDDRLKSLEMIAARITPAMLGNAAATQTFLESRISFKTLFNYGGIVTRLDGVAIADVPVSGRIGIDYSDREYMVEALKGKAIIGNPALGKKSQSPVFMMAAPIRDAKGKIIGVLAGTTDLNKPNFLSQITDNRYGKTGGYMLVSPKIRTIVYATDKKRIMEVQPAPGINPLIDRFIQGYEGSGIVVNPHGVEVLASAKGIPAAGWYVAALMPTAEAFAPIRAMLWRVLLAAIFLTLLAGGLTWWMLKRQLAPVFTTIQTLAALSDTDRPLQPLPVTRQDEIGELIGGFNRLLSTLGKRREALKGSEEQYRVLFESINDAVFVHDLDEEGLPGRFLQVNDVVCRRLGYTRDELLSLTPRDITTSEEYERISDKRIGFASRGDILAETVHLTKDGRKIPVESNVRQFRYFGRQVALSISRDITERKRAEEVLRDSEEKHRRIVEALSDAVLLRTKDIVIYANPAALKLFRVHHPEDLIGKQYLDLVHPDDRTISAERVKKHIDEGWFSSLREHRIMALDGQVVHVESTGGPVKYRGETQIFGVFRNITDRKRSEEEKTKLQDQLLQSQKMESVGRLAGGVAHDFNNMLGVILGHAEIALDQVDPSQPLHADLQEIRKAAVRSSDLTRQLLAFARKQTIAPRVLDINATVAGMLKMLQRLIGEDIRLAWLPGVNLWSVNIDPSQIDQVLANIFVNARDAIAGVGKVTIETGNIGLDEAYCADHAGFVPGDYVLLAVSDDGCGMDKETLSHLFEPFFTTKGVGKGTGLGLATVYGIVKQNNGFINVYSEPGHGTTFRIYLPRHIGKAEQARKEGPQEPMMRGHETVLVVEDEPALLDLSKLLLEKQGYRVLTAGTPGEALRLVGQHTGEIHLLMTDVVMPEMNGRDLARNLLSLHPNLKCLFMSGYTTNVIAHHGVLDDGVHFIQKPFSRRDMAAKVREALDITC
jgi:two-component system cell cycle sensor histidine kinase/response regulator CckA